MGFKPEFSLSEFKAALAKVRTETEYYDKLFKQDGRNAEISLSRKSFNELLVHCQLIISTIAANERYGNEE